MKLSIDELDQTDLSRKPATLVVDADENRVARTRDEMASESAALRTLFVDTSMPIPPS
jgi:hypothetical protein